MMQTVIVNNQVHCFGNHDCANVFKQFPQLKKENVMISLIWNNAWFVDLK